MAEETPAAAPETPETPPELEGEAAELAVRPNGRNKKLMFILGVAALGGTILGVGGTVTVSSLFREKPAAATPEAAPPPQVVHHVEEPKTDPRQETLIKELKEQNQRLENQLKVQADASREAAAKHDAPPKPETKVEPPPPKVIYRTVKSNEKPKVAEDCTISDKTDGLGERLKTCIDDFNKAVR